MTGQIRWPRRDHRENGGNLRRWPAGAEVYSRFRFEKLRRRGSWIVFRNFGVEFAFVRVRVHFRRRLRVPPRSPALPRRVLRRSRNQRSRHRKVPRYRRTGRPSAEPGPFVIGRASLGAGPAGTAAASLTASCAFLSCRLFQLRLLSAPSWLFVRAFFFDAFFFGPWRSVSPAFPELNSNKVLRNLLRITNRVIFHAGCMQRATSANA